MVRDFFDTSKIARSTPIRSCIFAVRSRIDISFFLFERYRTKGAINDLRQSTPRVSEYFSRNSGSYRNFGRSYTPNGFGKGFGKDLGDFYDFAEFSGASRRFQKSYSKTVKNNV